MQFIAKDLLTLGQDGTPNDSTTSSVADRALLTTELAAESLRITGRLRLRVRGESMLPTLWPGDVVEIASCSLDDVRTGQVALALREGRFFLHRVVARSPAGGFLLRGDSMPDADPEFPIGALIGRLASSPRALLPWPRVIGQLLCYCGPVRRLALRVHASRRRDMRANTITSLGLYLAPERGQECPRHTNRISELPSAGA